MILKTLEVLEMFGDPFEIQKHKTLRGIDLERFFEIAEKAVKAVGTMYITTHRVINQNQSAGNWFALALLGVPNVRKTYLPKTSVRLWVEEPKASGAGHPDAFYNRDIFVAECLSENFDPYSRLLTGAESRTIHTGGSFCNGYDLYIIRR